MSSKKRSIITIAGRPASGKSTAAKTVAQQLGFQHFSSGDLFRALARERGVDVLQANLSAEENAELDHLVDGRLQEMGATEDQLIIDSRTAWHWMPDSFKVFLDLDLVTGAQRILKDLGPERIESEHIPKDPAAFAETLQKRLDSESRRYKALYDIDPYIMDNYDLVIDTSVTTPEDVAQRILNAFDAWLTV
jgi:cytidylate kinase